MHECPGRLRRHIRAAYQVEQGKVLRVGAGDAIECTQFADSIRSADGAKTLDPGVAIRGVRCIQFVTAANPAHLRMLADGIVDGKGKVSRDSEDVGEADRTQAREHMLNNGHCHKKLRMERLWLTRLRKNSYF